MPLHWEPSRRKTLLLAVLTRIAAFRRFTTGRRRVPDSAVKSILVIELWNIGDLVLALPFLAALRTRFPSARISLLAGPPARELLDRSSLVDEVIVTTLGSDSISGWSKARELLRASREISRRGFDRAFQNRMHLREYALLALSGIAQTVGYWPTDQAAVLTDPVTPGLKNRHKTADWMSLLGSGEADSGGLEVKESEKAWATDFLARNGLVEGESLVGIHPGASKAEKRWPLDNFREVSEHLAQVEGIRLIAFADSHGFGAELWSVKGVIPAQVSLRQMVALLQQCQLVVCNDSGPMHIAASLGVPTVAIFDARVADGFRPVGGLHKIITAGRVSAVKVDQVLEAIVLTFRTLNLNGANALGRIIAIATDKNSTLASE